jgi:hypothetical protein
MRRIKTIIQLMRLMNLIGPMCLIGLISSCSSELEGPGTEVEKERTPIQLVGYMSPYTEQASEARGRGDSQFSMPNSQWSMVNDQWSMVNGQWSMVNDQWSMVNGMTRTEPAWMPEGYSLYTPPTDRTTAIGAFFTQDSPSPTHTDRRIFFSNNGTDADTSDDHWYVEGKEPPTGDFYLYGYMPYNAATVSIAANDTYAEGATLTFNDMNCISTKDICVVVGASHGTDTDTPATPQGLHIGKFGCTMKAGGSGNENYLFLLMEHLYAKLEFSFRVDNSAPYYYANLRTIKLRKVELMGYTYTLNNLSDAVVMKEKGDFVVELKSNDTDTSPIVNDILFVPDGSSKDMSPELLFEGDEELPTLTYTTETAYVPYFNLSGSGKVYYVLRSTYDVYDKQGNLIRQGCVAENLIVPNERFSLRQLSRGYKYTLQLTVMPTYLYMMSEPDLDNPSVAWE